MLLELQVTHSPNCIPKVLLFRLPSIWAEVFTYFMTCVFYILNNVTEFPFISILSYAYSFPVLCFCQSIPSLRRFYCRLSQLLPPLISVRLVYTLYWIVELFLPETPLYHLHYLVIQLGFKHLRKNHLARL